MIQILLLSVDFNLIEELFTFGNKFIFSATELDIFLSIRYPHQEKQKLQEQELALISLKPQSKLLTERDQKTEFLLTISESTIRST